MSCHPYTTRHALLVVFLTVVAAVAFWRGAIHPNISPKRFHVVAEGAVYRSGELTPATIRLIHRRHGIRTIVDFGTYPRGSPGDLREQRTAEALGIHRVRFDLEGDSTGNPNSYVEALRIMTDPQRQPVLVHCGAGTERTGMAVFLYRTIVEGHAPFDAMAEARRVGHDPARNPWLFIMLLEWRAKIEQAYREGGMIPGVEPLRIETAASRAP